ncbi:MAG: hypothetical protein DHS20C21_00480 [Gemmatimonadota bacterium]|nr:MAG: hypothetical protein DHS20C21_00480 [Gemmatimonadota bacterium]
MQRAEGCPVTRGSDLPLLLTPEDLATLLRTTKRAVYVAAARAQIPGEVRMGRRLLFRRDEVLVWLGLDEGKNQKRKGKHP